ncbi:predicted protein [Nematostella vectensis]|uniref:Potassium channel domain-containing protein n=3 Tax=Nematostella vectensis TaxID=45351 RepID=A7RLC5_NEMVE|nr:predicted protein [Nematostella vectensis]|eukprot:XP_001639731.1 predicted protein [Nematostella vectensis]
MAEKIHRETKRLLIRSFFFILYLVMGMVVFRFLESGHEKKEREQVQKDIQRIRHKFNISRKEMKEFVDVVQKAASFGLTQDWLEKWSYTGSLFFSGTVITTIGYGHLSPETFFGRIFCMLYALFGIPITWLMLTSLGKKIVEHISSFLQGFSSSCCNTQSKSFNFFCLLAAIGLSFVVMVIVAIVGIFSENWTFFEGFYFAFISLTTIGFGDYVPLHPNVDHKDIEKSSFRISLFVLFCMFLFSFGLAVTTSVLLSIRKIMEDHTILGFQALYSTTSDEEEERVAVNHEPTSAE